MREFKIERYFAKYEFSADYLLSPSDCESLNLKETLALADETGRALWENLHLGYTESQGHPLLREEIAKLYQKMGADSIVIAAPEECIFLIMQTVLRKSDMFMHPFPAYQSLYEIGASSGCKPVPWPLELKNGRWSLDIDMLKQHISRRMRLFVLNFPHNPTGYIPSLAEYEAIVDIARKNDIFIFSDEMYRFLDIDPAKSLPAICDIYEKGISLCGLSKSFSLPGLRIGWLATPHDALRNNLVRMKDYTTICNNAPGEILSIIALRAKEKVLTSNRAIVKENLALARQFFAQHEDKLQWIEPDGGPIAFPRLLLNVPILDFCEAAAANHSLMILPPTVYDYSGNHFRVGLGRRYFPQALDRFKAHLQQY